MSQTKYITVYKLTNTVNGKVYVGQTTDMERRLREHRRGKNANAAIHKAFVKYGPEAFKHEVICVCANKGASDAIEICLIKLWNTQKTGYNLTPGGLGTGIGKNNHRWGTTGTEKQRRATSESNRRRRGAATSNDTKKKLSEALKNRVFTEEHRQKLSAAQTGSKNHRYGTKASNETKAKLSAARKGVPKPEAFAAKQRENMLRIWAERKAKQEQRA
jgi:group I intron endonuclease